MKKQKPIIWKEETRKVSDLKPYERNPRTITKKEFEWMQQSLQEDGYHDRIRINTDNTIVSGHQRFRALKANGMKGRDQIIVLVPSRSLNVEEFLRNLIRSNHDAGDYDIDILSNNFEVMDLYNWGMDLEVLGMGVGFEPVEDDTRLDEKKYYTTKCPKCSLEFEVNGQGKTKAEDCKV
ncbi:MAG: hypothetical protein ACUZ8E_17995 [Candidatus Anammoxibacter sp.]